MQTGRSEDQDTPFAWRRNKRAFLIGTMIRGLHQGPRPYAPPRRGRTYGSTRPICSCSISSFTRRGRPHMPREEWAKPRGRKSIRPPLRLRRSRRSRPSARSSHGEAVWSARRTASSGEDVADVERPAQEARLSRRRKGNPGVQKGQFHDPAIRADGAAAADGTCLCRPRCARQPERSKEGPGVPGHADERHSAHQNPTDRR